MVTIYLFICLITILFKGDSETYRKFSLCVIFCSSNNFLNSQRLIFNNFCIFCVFLKIQIFEQKIVSVLCIEEITGANCMVQRQRLYCIYWEARYTLGLDCEVSSEGITTDDHFLETSSWVESSVFSILRIGSNGVSVHKLECTLKNADNRYKLDSFLDLQF